MDREYIKSVVYYANCLMRLLAECNNEDFVDDVLNTIYNADFGNLDMLRSYIDD